MKIIENTSLLPYNTFGIDVNADYFIAYKSVSELQEILQSQLVKSNRVLHIGCGSNLLFLSDFKGVILHSEIKNIEIELEDKNTVYLKVGAGVAWDDLVAYSVQNNWGGVENLSLIPGETGAAAVQNIGAYGVEVKDVIVQVNTIEFETGKIRVFSNNECKYGYRESIFKYEFKGKFIVTSILIRLDKNPVFKLNYSHLEDDVSKNGKINLQNIRKTIITIRESKLPNPNEFGNAGSFFMNPVISTSQFLKLQDSFPVIPHYFVSETQEKLAAAWLIEQCGWKGKSIGNAAVHDKQALVLINTGGASGAEIVHLAEQIQISVKGKFNVELQPEVNYI